MIAREITILKRGGGSILSKNNKQTMNARTHNPFNRYKENKNTNSNNQTPEEFGEEFSVNNKRHSERRKKNDH